jgi:hypothetical protein
MGWIDCMDSTESVYTRYGTCQCINKYRMQVVVEQAQDM